MGLAPDDRIRKVTDGHDGGGVMSEPDLLIDVTRTVSRAGHRHYSGVDRVERAYIEQALKYSGNCYFLTHVLAGFAVLDRDGMRKFLDISDGNGKLDQPDLISRVGRQNTALRRSESTVRRLGTHIRGSGKLPLLLKGFLRQGFWYLNVGHTNLRPAIQKAVRIGGAAKIATLIHDIIPLQYPEF